MPSAVERKFHFNDINLVANELAAQISAGMSVALLGELGAGKTTLVRALALSLGSHEPVSSPTYVLEHLYTSSSGQIIEHWDLYRLSAAPEDLLYPPTNNSLRLIEWADKFPEVLGSCDLILKLSFEAVRPGSNSGDEMIRVLSSQFKRCF